MNIESSFIPKFSGSSTTVASEVSKDSYPESSKLFSPLASSSNKFEVTQKSLFSDKKWDAKIKKIDRVVNLIFKAMCFATVVGLCAIFAYEILKPPFVIPPPPLHPSEIDLSNILGENALAFSSEDSRSKSLILLGADDHNNALKVSVIDPEWGETGIIRYIKQIDKTHDIRVKVIDGVDQMCEEIIKTSKYDNFISIIINAHGDQKSISFSDTYSFKNLNVYSDGLNIDKSCFSNLPKNVEFILISCKTGELEEGIAHHLAKLSGRSVWAPTEFASMGLTTFSNTVPPIPSFLSFDNIGKRLYGIETGCKFLPDGSRNCGLANRVWNAISNTFS